MPNGWKYDPSGPAGLRPAALNDSAMYAAALLMPSVLSPRPSHSSEARKKRSFFIRARAESSACNSGVNASRRATGRDRRRLGMGRPELGRWDTVIVLGGAAR